MAYLKIKNRAFSTLAADIISTATSLSVAAGEGAKFPSAGDFHITIEEGEIRTAKELGYKSRSATYIWSACVDCKRQRWVQVRKGEPTRLRCLSCAARKRMGTGSVHRGWKGGRMGDGRGYMLVRLYPDNPFYSMTNHLGYVLEHRLVVAKALGHCLQTYEVVHHKNGIRDDNRYPENLELIENRGRHNTRMGQEIRNLQQRIILLEAENVTLREQVKELKRREICPISK